MLWLVSGQIVVHCESVKARITTLSRKSLSDIRWLNWFVSVKFGAGMPFSDVPGSRSGLAAACRPAAVPAPGAPLPRPVEPPAAAQPATLHAATATAAAIVAAIRSLVGPWRPAEARCHDDAAQ